MRTPLPDAARERLAVRARRVTRIRRRVVAATLATFALAWGVIAYAGSMGAPVTTASASSGATTSSSGGSTASSDEPAAVTTAQS